MRASDDIASLKVPLPTRYYGLFRCAALLHPARNRERLLALIAMSDLHAYCDESETVGSTFAIAGYVAPAVAWHELEAAWVDALGDESLRGFHAYPCQNGKEQFKGKCREERRRIEDRFIRIVTDSDVQGFVSVIDLAAYDDLAAEFQELRAQGYWKAYLLAFQHQVELMTQWLNDQGVDPDEKVAVIFDRNDAFEGTAHELFSSVGRSKLGYAARLRSVMFSDSEQTPGIQAADLLAYEARKQFSEAVYSNNPRPPRQQWLDLYGGGGSPLAVRHFNRTALGDLIEALRALPGRNVR